MGVELTTALLNRLWAILENGQDTPSLVRVGNRIKRTVPGGPFKDDMAKAPADFPQIDIEVGRRGSHSGYNGAPNFAQEAAMGAMEVEFDIERTETVTITLKTDRVIVGGINPLKEAVVDDVMRAGPKLGLWNADTQSGVTAVGDIDRRRCFEFEYRYTRRNEKPFPGQITIITFPVSMLQHGRATLTGQE